MIHYGKYRVETREDHAETRCLYRRKHTRSVRTVEIVADAPIAALVPALVEELKLAHLLLISRRLFDKVN
ncbi:MAG: hypothetical protein NVS4B11_16830 [Ktedonobacteraceae bacterium]